MSKLLSVLKIDLSADDLARRIILDGFKIQKTCPDLIVKNKLPIPIAKHCRRRIAKSLNVHMDLEFHSLFDKAIRIIETER